MNGNSEKVAAAAIERLVAAKLVRAERAKKLEELIATGRLRADDWRLELELAASIVAAQ